MTVSYDFTGQVAFVTGASAGMGLAAARAFAESGASTVWSTSTKPRCARPQRHSPARGSTCCPLTCDVSDEAQVASAIANTVSTYGRLDAAFNNAGIMMPPLKTADTDNAIYDRSWPST